MGADIFHQFGQPLQLSASGDLLSANGSTYTQQRVLRRLLSAPAACVFHPEYGGGLPEMVGDPANGLRIAGTIRRQMKLEATVDQTTPPVVAVTVTPPDTVVANVTYVDASTGHTAVLAVQQPTTPGAVVS